MYLTLDNISKIFPQRGNSSEVTAVKDVSLEINKGELVTLLGPSGCGKTTTLRLIAGFEFPTKGQIVLDGKEINSLPPNKREMSMVFQSYAIFPHLNVYENIAYGLNVQHIPQAEIEKRMEKVMALVQLTGLEKRAPNQLSGGQQQRVALARALVMEPKVLLMDEPLSNLDAKLRENMRSEIRRIQKSLNITSVYVTHDQIEAMTLSDKVVIMNQGKIEQIGSPVEVYRYPNSRFVADFIGRANFVPGLVKGKVKDGWIVEVLGATILLTDIHHPVSEGMKVTLIVRPEMVKIGSANGKFKGKVRRAFYLGNVVDYEFEIANQVINGVETDPTRMTIYPEGTEINLDLSESSIQVLTE